MKFSAFLFFCSLSLFSCDSGEMDPDPSPPGAEMYFPPLGKDIWETQDLGALGWNESELDHLFTFLETTNTRAFIVLKNGKIAIERYWGNTITNTGDFDSNSLWYWASAGKALTATLVGIAQQEGDLSISHKTSDYLGAGWTSLPMEKENLITIRNQLSMTTGLNFGVTDLDCTEPDCLTYRRDAGGQWYYHNAPYTLLEEVVSRAAAMDYNRYTDEKIESKIGMNGQWIRVGFNNVYWSTARDMARFGLLTLAKGIWDGKPILADEQYFEEMVTTTQSINPSYGYLWWLNGKNSIVFPGFTVALPITMSSAAPADLFAGMGKNGQFVDIVPSQNLVVIRMGEAPDAASVPIAFHNEMWQKLNAMIGN